MKPFPTLVNAQRQFFATGATRPLAFRLDALKKLENAVVKYSDEISAALYADLKKPPLEAFVNEVAIVLDEVRLMQKKLGGWMRPQSVSTPIHLQPGKSEIHRDPLGVVLILSPWNYPFQLALAPLLGAVAAGNCVILKPSELAPQTAQILAKIVAECFDPHLVTMVEGGVAETTELLKLKYDHIFFTGSIPVGRIVMKAAAEHLTPVTLELGGKSPTIVSQHADLEVAARRIAWGKFLNAGQTCIAPDYVYVQASVADVLAQKICENIEAFYTKDAKSSDSYARIINEKNFDRLAKLLPSTKPRYGGAVDRATLYMEPTVIMDATWQDRLMQDEIFGPILPLMRFESLDEVFTQIKAHDKPLAAYFFSQNEDEVERFLTELSFGGGCINDIVLHLANSALPFGGVGASGMGAYHGERSYLTFTHEKSILRKSRWLDFDFRYPPYKASHLKMVKRIFGVR